MRKIHVLAAALAGVFLALPALATPNLAGTTWDAAGTGDECEMAFSFRADSSFFFMNDVDGEDRSGHWRLEAGILHLQYERGGSVQTQISDDLFELGYLDSNGKRYRCRFTPLPDF